MEYLSKDRVVILLDETSSTNLELKNMQKMTPQPEGSMIIADFQTQGRGQGSSSWFSSRGNNLLFSFLLYPHFVLAKEQFIISRIVSLALKKILDRFTPNITIKWPNDIYWNDKKIAGMLIENSLIGPHIDFSIVGIGLNVNEEKFPDELPNPVSLKQITGHSYNRDNLLNDFYEEFFFLYRRLQNGEVSMIEKEYMMQLYRIDNFYWFEDKDDRFRAKIKIVLPSGHLVLETHIDKEERKYAFKEVSFISED